MTQLFAFPPHIVAQTSTLNTTTSDIEKTHWLLLCLQVLTYKDTNSVKSKSIVIIADVAWCPTV